MKKVILIMMGLFLSFSITGETKKENEAGKIQFSKGKYKVLEKDGSIFVTIQRLGGNKGRVSVILKTIGQTAVAGKDFEPVEKKLIFADGDSESKQIKIKLITDGKIESKELFEISLENATGGAEIGPKGKSHIEILSPLISNDGIVMGILAVILAFVFVTSGSQHPKCKKFYKYVPALLLCYFLPSILGSLNIISGEISNLYFVSSRFLLPACLVMLCLSIDMQSIIRLGPKTLIMFFTGTFGIIFGGPLALFIVGFCFPDTIVAEGANATWSGMATVAGSWIGGGANQTAMKEVFDVGDQIFSAMVTVDVLVANVWMAILLYMAAESELFDKKLKADNSAIKELQKKMEDYQNQISKIPNLTDMMKILGVGFGITAIGHLGADLLGPWIGENAPQLKKLSLHSKFFWLIVLATLGGLMLSFTKVRELEGVGASRVGSAFLYILVASIGMKMDLFAIFRSPMLFLIGAIWIAFHAVLLISMAKIIRAPVFFLAVGSQANIGGAASAPVVASAFHPTLAPVGVLLAVLGYAVGTFGAWACGLLMKLVSGIIV